MSAEIVAVNNNEARLSGELVHQYGTDLLHQGERLLESAGDVWTLDLADVTHSSSVGIALLTGWMRHGKQYETRVEFRNMPTNMRDMIRFNGLEGLFGY